MMKQGVRAINLLRLFELDGFSKIIHQKDISGYAKYFHTWHSRSKKWVARTKFTCLTTARRVTAVVNSESSYRNTLSFGHPLCSSIGMHLLSSTVMEGEEAFAWSGEHCDEHLKKPFPLNKVGSSKSYATAFIKKQKQQQANDNNQLNSPTKK